MQSKVALVKSKYHFKGVTDTLGLLEKRIRKKLRDIEQVVVKVNFVTIHSELATTPFKAVKAFVRFIRLFYKNEIVIAEEATGGDTKIGFEKFGFTQLANEDPKIKLLDLGDDATIEKKVKFPGGEVVLPLSRTLLNAPFLVSISRAKTHDTVVVTLGIKNVAVGVIQGGWGERVKVHKGKHINHIITNISEIVYPNLVIIDGTIGMEGNGPVSGKPINSGWVVSSFDPLLADSLATNLMGFKVKDVGYLNLMSFRGMGKLFPQDNYDIEVLGENPKKLITPYKPHDTFEEQRRWR